VSVHFCICTSCLPEMTALLSGKYRLRAVKSVQGPRTSSDDAELIVAVSWAVSYWGRRCIAKITPSFLAQDEVEEAQVFVDWSHSTMDFSLSTASRPLYSVLRVPFEGTLVHYQIRQKSSSILVTAELLRPASLMEDSTNACQKTWSLTS
jgi:hypothetical protein